MSLLAWYFTLKNLQYPICAKSQTYLLSFSTAQVKHKVIIVPGVFFDINPRHIRNLKKSKCISFVRFSYGPAMENLEKGLRSIKTLIEYWKNHQESPEVYAQESLE